jgi:predicted nucleic acid-binding protein
MRRSCCSSRRAILDDCNSDFAQTLNLAVFGCILLSAKARALMLENSGDLRALVIGKFVIRKFVIRKFVIKMLVFKNFCDQGASSRAT